MADPMTRATLRAFLPPGMREVFDLFSGAAIAVDTVSKVLPEFEDEVVVEAVGQPGVNRSVMYYMAVSAAIGAIRPLGFGVGIIPPIGLFMIEYDAADNWVRVTMRIKVTALTYTADTALTFFAGGGGRALVTGPIVTGPRPELIGGTLPALGGLIPPLPAAGTIILTTNPNPVGIAPSAMNPKPPGDLRSRGAVVRGIPPGSTGPDGTWDGSLTTDMLVPMVFAALTNPGSSDQVVFSPVAGSG